MIIALDILQSAGVGAMGTLVSKLLAMMITLYIAMDSFGTACNVTGDGAIAVIPNRITKKNAYLSEFDANLLKCREKELI